MIKCAGPHENKITGFLAGSSRQGTLLGNEVGELVGNITRGDVVRAFERSGDPSVTVLDVGSTNLILADEDETSHDAIARMLRHDVGRLPVVDRANKKRAVGILAPPVFWQRASVIIAMSNYANADFVKLS